MRNFENNQISLNSVRFAMNQQMGVSEDEQFVQQTDQKQLILEKLDKIRTLGRSQSRVTFIVGY